MTEGDKNCPGGNQGAGIRSDCSVNLTLNKSGGREIKLTSKVDVMYGNSIRNQVDDILKFFDIEHATVEIIDTGALPFVIAARMEAAIKKLIDKEKEYLTELIEINDFETNRDIDRISRLYLPGNTPNLMINAGIHKPNGIILDLEDAVAPAKKFEASFLVRNALRSMNFYGAERMVRINQVPRGLHDLEFIVPQKVNLILIPKCETPRQIHAVNRKIQEIRDRLNLRHQIWLMPIIESALGVQRAFQIASSADNIVALAIGLEDYTADIGTSRTPEGKESFYARSRVVNAARATGIQPIDSVFSDVNDEEGLIQNVRVSKSLGFEGMGCIHPRQIKIIHDSFAPDDQEIDKAKKIVKAFSKAKEEGLGVVSLGTKMIDPPVVKRALRTIKLAIKSGRLNQEWENEDDQEKNPVIQ